MTKTRTELAATWPPTVEGPPGQPRSRGPPFSEGTPP